MRDERWLNPDEYVKFVFIDTETTGLPRDEYASPYAVDEWPRIVQMSWIIADSTKRVFLKRDYIIRPEGFIIPYKAVKIHGIDTNKAMREGYPIQQVLNTFIADCSGVDYVVGYNINFDERVVDAELIRAGLPLIMEDMSSICVMRHHGVFANFGDGARDHYPSLGDLYLDYFSRFMPNAHNSLADVQATMEIFWAMREKEIYNRAHPKPLRPEDLDDLPF